MLLFHLPKIKKEKKNQKIEIQINHLIIPGGLDLVGLMILFPLSPLILFHALPNPTHPLSIEGFLEFDDDAITAVDP